MAYSPTIIANNILSRSFDEKKYITPMKLQKILYFVASEYQKATRRPLLEEPFGTWAYGPVVYSVYNEFRSYGKDVIRRYAADAKGKPKIVDESSDIQLRIALDRVWEATKKLTAIELSNITHYENSAWDKAYQTDQRYLDSEDVTEDATYVDALGLKA